MSEYKKPRICEVLGVEVEERWKVEGGNNITYKVNAEGEILMERVNGSWAVSNDFGWLAKALNGNVVLVHMPRWTQEDIENAKAIKRLFPGIEAIHRGGYNCTGLYIHDSCHYKLNDELFPSLEEGESVTLDEILEADCEI